MCVSEGQLLWDLIGVSQIEYKKGECIMFL